MVITLTPISRSQWGKVAKVALWLLVSFGITLVPAYLTKHYTWLGAAPGVNLILYTIGQVSQQDLTNAEGQLPASEQGQVDQVVAQVEKQESPSDLPSTATPGSV